MAEAASDNNTDEVDDQRRNNENKISDQVIDPWCEPCLEETKVKVEAVGYCPKCNIHFCLNCHESHKKWPSLQNHRLLRGSRMPQSHADKPIRYPSCVLHAENYTDHYCRHHGSMVCNDCLKKGHRGCEALPIPDVCKSIGSEDVKRFKLATGDMQQKIKDTKAVLQTNISDLESHKESMIKTAEKQRDRLISKVKDMFEETVSNINSMHHKTKSEIAEHIEILSDENRQFDEIINNFDKKTYADIDTNCFIQIQNIVASATESKVEIEDMIRQFNYVELSLDLNNRVNQFYEEKHIGSSKETLIPLSTCKELSRFAFPEIQLKKRKPPCAMDISKICLENVSSFNVETKLDSNPANYINGMAITGNGTLLIGNGMKMVQIVSTDNSLLNTFEMSDAVYDIAVINDTEAVVSTTKNKLHVLDISNLPLVAIRKTVSLNYVAFCLTPCGDNIVVASQEKKPCLKMIDNNGKEIWNISTESDNQQLFDDPFAVKITTFNGTKAAVVTDSKKSTITIIDINNGAVLKIKEFTGKNLYGITVDDNGNIFVCSNRTREILVLSHDFTESRVILDSQSLHARPRVLLYRKPTDELYVAYSNGQIDRFKISASK